MTDRYPCGKCGGNVRQIKTFDTGAKRFVCDVCDFSYID